MKRLTALACALCLVLAGCGTVGQTAPTRYSATFLELFDTVTTVLGFADSKADFEAAAAGIREELQKYHQLFDVYTDYDGINNLKTVNDNAGLGPVKVDGAIIELLLDCKEYHALTGGRVNVAFGSVLKLWHDAREAAFGDPGAAYLPAREALEEAAAHTDIEKIVIDEAASTVYLEDPGMRLDVGAVAKGWAAQRVSQTAPAGLLLSVGGNVCATGPKADGTPWVVGIQNPDGGDKYLHTVTVSEGSVVTSGDYQRAFTLDGKLYHHIIDPEILFPGEYWRSVSIVCPDSGLADALSTALFLMPLEEGKALVEACEAEAMWVDRDGKIFYSKGFEGLIRT